MLLWRNSIETIRAVIADGKVKVEIQVADSLGTPPFFLRVFQLYLHLSMSSDSNLAFTPTGKYISLSTNRCPKKINILWVVSHSGVFACDFVGGTAHYIGSLNHENSDAASFAAWGADYLKVWSS